MISKLALVISGGDNCSFIFVLSDGDNLGWIEGFDSKFGWTGSRSLILNVKSIVGFLFSMALSAIGGSA